MRSRAIALSAQEHTSQRPPDVPAEEFSDDDEEVRKAIAMSKLPEFRSPKRQRRDMTPPEEEARLIAE